MHLCICDGPKWTGQSAIRLTSALGMLVPLQKLIELSKCFGTLVDCTPAGHADHEDTQAATKLLRSLLQVRPAHLLIVCADRDRRLARPLTLKYDHS